MSKNLCHQNERLKYVELRCRVPLLTSEAEMLPNHRHRPPLSHLRLDHRK